MLEVIIAISVILIFVALSIGADIVANRKVYQIAVCKVNNNGIAHEYYYFSSERRREKHYKILKEMYEDKPWIMVEKIEYEYYDDNHMYYNDYS